MHFVWGTMLNGSQPAENRVHVLDVTGWEEDNISEEMNIRWAEFLMSEAITLFRSGCINDAESSLVHDWGYHHQAADIDTMKPGDSIIRKIDSALTTRFARAEFFLYLVG